MTSPAAPLDVLLAVLAKAEKALTEADAPTAEHLAAYERAAAAVERARGGGAAPVAEAPVLETGFKGTRRAEAYLKEQGYRCDHSTLARALKAQKLNRNAQGEITKASLDLFALTCDRLDGAESDDEKSARLAREKQEHEVRKLAAEADRGELKLGRERGLLVERARMEKELTARAIQLRGDFESWAHEVPLRIVDTYDLGADAIPELKKLILAAGKEWFGRYTDTREFVTPLIPEPTEPGVPA